MERKVIKGLPSSFVAVNMKLLTDRGAGEAKLWVGPMSNSDELDRFFSFDENYKYLFSKTNMLEYLNQVKVEYVYQKFNNYKNASLATWTENYELIESMTEEQFEIHLKKFTDETRYYVRADEEIFRKTLRKVAIPKLTNIVFEKDSEKREVIIKLELNLEYGSSTDENNDIMTDVLSHNLFGIHIKNLNDALSEENPHICIGWSQLGDLTSISSRNELEQKYKEVWPDDKARAVGQNVGQIWRFIKEAQINDYVIFADGGLCHIGRIESDYIFDIAEREEQSPDYVNNRRVAWLRKNINRADLSESMHHSLMTAMSFWTMNDYRSVIADLINGTYVKDEPVSYVDGVISAEEQQECFRRWMNEQKKADGEPYSQRTINNYISTLNQGYALFEKYHEYNSIFEIQNEFELNEYKEYLFNAPGFDDFNQASGKKSCSNGLEKYILFVKEVNSEETIVQYKTSLEISLSRNRIVFGAPGTGKSFSINEERKKLLGKDNETDYERVTFHPDYSYANFVGTYKPVPCKDESGNDAITYEYVPGPFMRVYVKALKNAMSGTPRPFLLLIEEINRANVAAVFGDIFQLLDRNEDEISEYPIQASEDIKKYLSKELNCGPDKVEKIRIPDNMFIWATMNSADQGVFPMDTAFKRRWDFTYIGIDDNDDDIQGMYVVLGSSYSQHVEWNALRKAINHFLTKQKINEDKLLGPYFISRKVVVPDDGCEIDKDRFCETFKNKVIMYLFEDAAKQKRQLLFEGCFDHSNRFSEICKEFDEHGIGIFNREIITECENATEDITINDHVEGELPS